MKKVLIVFLNLLILIIFCSCHIGQQINTNATLQTTASDDQVNQSISYSTVSMTLDIVTALSLKGNDLTWSDLKGYNYSDVGSGRYIYVFPIDENWQLLINSGASLSGEKIVLLPPVMLVFIPTYEGIDIKDGQVEDFITDHLAAETGK